MSCATIFPSKRSTSCLWRLLDVFFLVTVFIAQSVILSLFTVYSKADSELPYHYVNPVFQKFLWLTGDLICLLGFFLACIAGLSHLRRKGVFNKSVEQSLPEGELKVEADDNDPDSKKEQKTDDQRTGDTISNDKVESINYPSKYSFLGYLSSEKLPLIYISWFFYAALLTLKIAVISSEWMDQFAKGNLTKDDSPISLNLEPDTLLLGIGLSGLVFSLLVEAHHNAGKEDMKRNSYLNHISYGVALEILDTVSDSELHSKNCLHETLF